MLNDLGGWLLSHTMVELLDGVLMADLGGYSWTSERGLSHVGWSWLGNKCFRILEGG